MNISKIIFSSWLDNEIYRMNCATDQVSLEKELKSIVNSEVDLVYLESLKKIQNIRRFFFVLLIGLSGTIVNRIAFKANVMDFTLIFPMVGVSFCVGMCLKYEVQNLIEKYGEQLTSQLDYSSVAL